MALFTPPASSRSDFEQQLLGSAGHDTVPEGSRRNVARALGIAVGAPVGKASELPRAPRPGAGPGTPAAGVAAQASLELSLLGKAALVAIAGGAVALGAALLPARAPSAAAATAAPITASASVAPASAAPQREVSPELARLAAGELSEVRPGPERDPAGRRAPSKRPARIAATGNAGAAAAPQAPDVTGSRLLDEVRQLDAARNALGAGHPSQALGELERYKQEFPDGTLALDAALLEVRALDRSGQRATAHRQARQLLSRPGAERHRAELEAIVNPLASGSQTRRRDIVEAR